MFNVMKSLFGRRSFSRPHLNRAQILSRATEIAVRGLEDLERRVFLSATAPISWQGQVKTAYADEWVLKLSDSYLQQSAKAAANGIADADLGPFTTLIEDGGYNIRDASIERAPNNPGYAILHAPFSRADAIESWGDSLMQDNEILHTSPAFESVSPYFTDLAIPTAVTQSPGSAQHIDPAAALDEQPIATSPLEKPESMITWQGTRAAMFEGNWIIGLSNDFWANQKNETTEEQPLEKSLLDAGVDVQTIVWKRVGASDSRVVLQLGSGQSAAFQKWAASAASLGASYIEPNWAYKTQSFDDLYSTQWGLSNTGGTIGGITGVSDADIDGPEAWGNTQGSGVIVAVIDSGVDWDHADLDSNIWANPNENIDTHDTDGDGFTDDVRGWDFWDGDNNPDHGSGDPLGHGTGVAGVIAAERNGAGTGTGVIGAAYAAKIMPLRVGYNTMIDADLAADAIDYAIWQKVNKNQNIRVINCSFAGPASTALHSAIGRANSAGILVVVAAGNSGQNIDSTPTYPASYTDSNIISVAGTQNADARWSGTPDPSNYGATSVDLAAPGYSISSTAAGGGWASWIGTSVAAPYVSATVALIASAWPSATMAELKSAILDHVDTPSALNGLVATNGRLNAAQSLRNEKLLVGALDNAVAYDGNVVHLAYFNNVDKQLYYVQRNSSGVWSAPVAVEPGGGAFTEVGRYVSISIDSGGGIGLAYYDAGNADLRYAHSTNGTSWSTELVHGASISGKYPSLQFDGTIPVISYYRDGTVNDLWFADKTSGSWVVSAVDSTGDVGRFSSLAANPNTGAKWSVTYEDTTNGDLKYATETTGGVWSTVVADNLTGGAAYSSLKFNGTTASVSFYDSFNANLIFATRSGGGTWTAQTVASTGTVGLYTTLLLDGSNPVIVYHKSNTDELFEAALSGGSWNITTLEQGGGGLASAGLTSGGHLGYSWFDTSENDVQFFEN